MKYAKNLHPLQPGSDPVRYDIVAPWYHQLPGSGHPAKTPNGRIVAEQLAHLDKRHEEERKEAEATAGAIGGMFGAFMTSTPSKSESKDG